MTVPTVIQSMFVIEIQVEYIRTDYEQHSSQTSECPDKFTGHPVHIETEMHIYYQQVAMLSLLMETAHVMLMLTRITAITMFVV